MKKLSKNRIIAFLICALFVNQVTYAGAFVFDQFFNVKYKQDDGTFATGWRWIDTNNDNIAECYRFDDNGVVVASSNGIKGKKTDSEGRWVVDGVVQQIYKSTGKPLYSANAGLGDGDDENEYFSLTTDSNTTKRINATKKDVKALMMKDLNADEEALKKSKMGPEGRWEGTEEGYVMSKGAKIKKVPVATVSTWLMIDDAIREDDPIYLTGTQSIIAGKDMRKFVSASNKYTEKVDGVKIWGGEVWDDVMCLQGNGAYVKFNTQENNSKFRANYFICEVAHQTHGESTADTDCGIEVYLNGKSITVYDSFCDDKPEIIEEWLDENESNVELRAVITGDAPGRKIYIRNARFRQIREKKDD